MSAVHARQVGARHSLAETQHADGRHVLLDQEDVCQRLVERDAEVATGLVGGC